MKPGTLGSCSSERIRPQILCEMIRGSGRCYEEWAYLREIDEKRSPLKGSAINQKSEIR